MAGLLHALEPESGAAASPTVSVLTRSLAGKTVFLSDNFPSEYLTPAMAALGFPHLRRECYLAMREKSLALMADQKVDSDSRES